MKLYFKILKMCMNSYSLSAICSFSSCVDIKTFIVIGNSLDKTKNLLKYSFKVMLLYVSIKKYLLAH